jgi:hypothetical protein
MSTKCGVIERFYILQNSDYFSLSASAKFGPPEPKISSMFIIREPYVVGFMSSLEHRETENRLPYYVCLCVKFF